MQPLTPSELAASRRRQAMLEKWSERLAVSTASKVRPEQRELLPEQYQNLAGSRAKDREKKAGLRTMLPDFLSRKLTRWSTILQLKMLAWSLKRLSSSYWWQQRMALRIKIFFSSSNAIPRPKRGASPISSSSRTKRKSILGRWRFGFGANTSVTTTSSPMNRSRESSSSNIACGISRVTSKPARSKVI